MLIACCDIICGCHDAILLEFGVVVSCTSIILGFRCVDCQFVRAGVAISAMVNGVLAIVAQRYVCGFVTRTCGYV